MKRTIDAGKIVTKYSGVAYAWPCRKFRARVPSAIVREENDTASSTASQTMTTAATGFRVMGREPCLGPNWIWVRAMSIETIAARAAARLIVVTASVLPMSTWARGA